MRFIIIALLLYCTLFSPLTAGYYDPIVTGSRETLEYLDGVADAVGYERFDRISFRYAMHLGKQMGQLDRIAVSPEEFVAHIEAATAVKERFFSGMGDEVFLTYLLPLRIRGEHTSHSDWRPLLKSQFEPLIKDAESPSAAARRIFDWIDQHIQLTDYSFSYLLADRGDLDPLTTLKGRRGTEPDLAVLGCAILRSQGIPARIVWVPYFRDMTGGKVWLEYMDDAGDWQAWFPSLGTGEEAMTRFQQMAQGTITLVRANPSDPVVITDRYSPTARVTLIGVNDAGQPQPSSLMVLNDDTFRPVFARAVETRFDFEYGVEVGPGSYIVSVGTRKGKAALKPIRLQAGDHYWYAFNTDSGAEAFGQGVEPPAAVIQILASSGGDMGGQIRLSPHLNIERLPGLSMNTLSRVRDALDAQRPIPLGQTWLDQPEQGFQGASVSVGWQPEQIVIYARIQDDRASNRAQRLNEMTWKLGDTFAVFLKDEQSGHYLEIQVSPENQRLQLKIPNPRPKGDLEPFHIAYSSVIFSETKVDPKSGLWELAVTVPTSLLCETSQRLVTGQKIKFSFSRYDFGEGREEPLWSSSSAHSKPDFYDISEWGVLTLVENED